MVPGKTAFIVSYPIKALLKIRRLSSPKCRQGAMDKWLDHLAMETESVDSSTGKCFILLFFLFLSSFSPQRVLLLCCCHLQLNVLRLVTGETKREESQKVLAAPYGRLTLM